MIDTATNTVTGTIPIGAGPFAIGFPTTVQADPIGLVTAQVQALVAGHSLAEDQDAALIHKLQ